MGSGILKTEIRIIALTLPLLLLAACASLPKDYPRVTSTALTDYQSTRAHAFFASDISEHPGESGFALVRSGRAAFTDRIAMARIAEQTLDLQYYIWEADTTGRILACRVIAAADRGVRIRILVDDLTVSGRDSAIATMNAHPDIEIRMFNPFANRRSRAAGFVTDFNRVNHRMHNKVMIMDNALAMIGGRNIGDHYFGVDADSNFRDLDVFAVGPIVRDASVVFDLFWNGEWSIPIEALAKKPYTQQDLVTATGTLCADVTGEYPYPLDQDVDALATGLKKNKDKLVWAKAQVVFDDPVAVAEESENQAIRDALSRKLETITEELLIESAYFVPGKRGVEAAATLEDRGVEIRVLTNSLASNDVVPAHAGYAKYRDDLIEEGVEVYELRPDAGKNSEQASNSSIGESRAALHTKALVFDREAIFVGSFNLDPRSANINTEIGVYIESEQLATQLATDMDEAVQPEYSYRVTIDEDGDMVWSAKTDGEEVRYYKEPETSFWRRFSSGFYGLMPIESQL